MSNKEDRSTTYRGVSTIGLLGVVFVTLKLTEEIDWAWKWVLAPFWIPWAVALVAVAIGSLIYLLVQGVKFNQTKKRGIEKDGRRY